MPSRTSPVRELFRLFQNRFFESDAVSAGASFGTNIYQALGILAAPGIFISLFAGPLFEHLSHMKPGPMLDGLLRMYRLIFPAYSFAVVGFATLFEWDMLFPSRRDFLILSPFPIRMRDLFGAKLAALSLFLVGLIVAVNGFSMLLIPLFSSAVGQVRSAGILRLTLVQIAATGVAAAFAFFAVAAFQGLLINLVSPRIFRRISPWIQMFGMSVMVLFLLLFPLYAMMMKPVTQAHTQWLWYFPPYWFAGIYDLLLAQPDSLFTSLGLFAFNALGSAVGVFGVTWAVGFRRHYRRTLEAEDTETRVPRFAAPLWFVRSPEQRAIYEFIGATLARSAKHRLFIATYVSVGIAFGLLVTFVVRAGNIDISPQGLRSFPLLVAFFVVSGLRAAFQFPAELQSNWLFQITEDSWSEISRKATRKRVLTSGLAPTLLLFLPIEMAAWGWQRGLFHFAFQLATGVLLIEALFWNFDKVPFTCSYFPGRINLALLSGLYLYGFTNYSFQMADLEAWLERSWGYAALFFTVTLVALAFLWLRRPVQSAVRFDAGEQQIQTLDLT
ncbi:MAG: hypothetical protein JWO48_489 [Bryobacterales bacterium]|nr:hypothetical protein [Bryobacterales bacterium]